MTVQWSFMHWRGGNMYGRASILQASWIQPTRFIILMRQKLYGIFLKPKSGAIGDRRCPSSYSPYNIVVSMQGYGVLRNQWRGRRRSDQDKFMPWSWDIASCHLTNRQ